MARLLKTLSLTLIVVLICGAWAFAADFTDVARDSWAKAYIDRMYLKGVINGLGNGKFGPDESLTRAQAVTMLVRILGYSEDSIPADKAIPASFKNPAAVPGWAKKYIAVGVEQGIIAGSDLENFRPNDPAKRWEVAVMAVRALGLAGEAESRANVNLSFTDTYLIPLSARSYVEVAVEKGVIQGMPDGTFKPMDSLTRAQGAAMFSRVDDLVQNSLDADEIRGSVVEVDDSALPSVTVRLAGGAQKVITVNNATTIYRENKLIRLQDLKPGDGVTVLMNDTGTYALLICATAGALPVPTNTNTTSGTIKTVDTKTRYISIISTGGKTDSYIISPEALIFVDDATAGIEDLAVGQVVELEILKDDPNTVIRVKAQGVDETVKGRVTFVYNAADNPFITIKDSDDKSRNYSVSSSVVVTRNGKAAKLDDLRNGDVAELMINNSRVVKITAEPAEKSISGSLKGISYAGADPVIKIDDSGDEYEFPVSEDVDVERNRRNAKLTDLRVGDDVDVLLEYDFDEEDYYVTEITAESVDRDISGTFRGFGISDDITITITNDETGKDETFILSDDARIRKDGSRISPQDINIGFQGYYVEIEVESDVIVKMDITTRETKEFITGTVDAVNESNMIISLKNWTYGTGKIVTDEQKAILVTDDTKYMKGNSTTRLRYLKAGDAITAFGKTRGGIFTAELVVVMND